MTSDTVTFLDDVLPLIDQYLNEKALSRIVPPPGPHRMRRRATWRLRQMQRELSGEPIRATGTPKIQVGGCM